MRGGTVMYSWPWFGDRKASHGHEYMTVPPKQIRDTHTTTMLTQSRTLVTILSAAVAALAVTPVARAADAPSGRPPLTFSNDPKPPVGTEGWKVETVLLAPKIESPSVVCALPDGRVLIGED